MLKPELITAVAAKAVITEADAERAINVTFQLIACSGNTPMCPKAVSPSRKFRFICLYL